MDGTARNHERDLEGLRYVIKLLYHTDANGLDTN